MAAFPAVVLTGARRVGKTYLLKKMFPRADYVLLEDPAVVARVRSDPQGFLDELRLPVILDEIQNTPELFAYVRARIDGTGGEVKRGQWILTGSQESALMHGVTESMAGRAAILQLLPLSHEEYFKVDVLNGGFPEAMARPNTASLWFSSYVQTYIERDIRAMTAVRDIAVFRRFIAVLASRHGQVLNKTELAAPLGVSVPTITQWLSLLETTAQIFVIPPYFENLGKRLIKSPKLYIADSGLACHLLGIESVAAMKKSPFCGALFEGFVAAEILKWQVNAGRRRELYYFRDQQGFEVDFLVPRAGGGVAFIECKAGKTVLPPMASALRRALDAWKMQHGSLDGVSAWLIHQPAQDTRKSNALAPSIRAGSCRDFLASF